jgi:hypothetical protein
MADAETPGPTTATALVPDGTPSGCVPGPAAPVSASPQSAP